MLVLVYEARVSRRSGTSCTLYAKDSAGGDALFRAPLALWAKAQVELSTKQSNVSTLDRYIHDLRIFVFGVPLVEFKECLPVFLHASWGHMDVDTYMNVVHIIQ